MKLNNLSKHLFFSAVLLLLCFGLKSQDTHIKELSFQDQEQITYKIYYNWKFIWIPAGEVVFKVNEKDDHFEFSVTGYSYESYDSFFKVRDHYLSRTSKEDLLPVNFRRNILEGNYTCYDSLSFNQTDFSVYEKFGKTQEMAEDFNFQLENTVHDMVSAIYYLRSFPIDEIEKDTKLPFRIFFDKEFFNLDIKYVGQKKIKIKELGKVNTLHFQPQLVSGYVFKEGDVMDVYVTEDGNKLPLLIESPISFGSVKAILKTTSGLKYESAIDLKNKG